jgi:CRP/FNR family transcriptional regulator, cyclic AMP receptor protein
MSLINYFKNAKEFKEYKAGQPIFQEGEKGNLMYAVREGEVNIVYNDHIMETVTSGGFFGEMALIDEAPRSASAVAKTDCVIVPVDRDRFIFLVHETPTFALQVMHAMAERLRAMNKIAQ